MRITLKTNYFIYFLIFLLCISFIIFLPKVLYQKHNIYFIIIASICEIFADLCIAKLASIYLLKKIMVKHDDYTRLYRVEIEEFYEVMLWILLIGAYSLKQGLFIIEDKMHFDTLFLIYMTLFMMCLFLFDSSNKYLYINNQFLLFPKNMKISLKDIKAIEILNSAQASVITDYKIHTIHATKDNIHKIKDKIRLV